MALVFVVPKPSPHNRGQFIEPQDVEIRGARLKAMQEAERDALAVKQAERRAQQAERDAKAKLADAEAQLKLQEAQIKIENAIAKGQLEIEKLKKEQELRLEKQREEDQMDLLRKRADLLKTEAGQMAVDLPTVLDHNLKKAQIEKVVAELQDKRNRDLVRALLSYTAGKNDVLGSLAANQYGINMTDGAKVAKELDKLGEPNPAEPKDAPEAEGKEAEDNGDA